MFANRKILALFPLYVFSLPALAQPVLEEIVVTADYRLNVIDDIPASISVIDADTMSRKNAQHLEDILLNTPNVNFASGGSRARFIQIRGIGERGQFSEPLNSSVGMLIDGVDFSGIGNAAMLYDVEQIEVWIEGKIQSGSVTKLFVSAEGAGGIKLVLKPKK